MNKSVEENSLDSASQVESPRFYSCSIGKDEEEEEEIISPPSRRLSQESSSTTATNFYDSGNFSSSNGSVCLPSTDNDSAIVSTSSVNDLLRERDNAMQDVRKLHSVVERLSKSEEWYKSALDCKKRSRRQIVEKFHENEKKYTEENQNLQKQCLQLFTRCDELEKALKEKQKELSTIQSTSGESINNDNFDLQFEIEQQKAIICDQQKLIDALRKQKHSLLDDLKCLSSEKDALIFNLEKALLEQQNDNLNITKNYIDLVKVNDDVEARFENSKNDLAKFQQVISKLQQDLEIQLNKFKEKESLLTELQIQLDNPQSNSSQIRKLQEEIHSKNLENILLQSKIDSLQTDCNLVLELRQQSERQQIEINQLMNAMRELEFEKENLKRITQAKSKQNEKLQQEIELYRKIDLETKENAANHDKQLSQRVSLELERTKTELKTLNQKYSEMCSLCEKVRFDLNMREIAIEKLRFERRSDLEEIDELRAKVTKYSTTCDKMKIQIEKFEQLITVKDAKIEMARESQQSAEMNLRDLNEKIAKKLSESENCAKVMQNEIFILKKNISDKNENLEIYKKEKLIYEQELKELRSQFTKLTDEKEKAQIATLEKELAPANLNKVEVMKCHKNCDSFETKLISLQQELLTKDINLEELIQEQQLKDREIEKLKAQITELKTFSIAEKDLHELRNKYSTLNEILRIENLIKEDSCSHENRIRRIQKLIAQKSAKVQQLTTNEEEWQILLTALNKVKSESDQSSICDTMKFSEPQTDDMKQTFQIEFDSIEKRLKSTESQEEIKRLNGRNEWLAAEFTKDFPNHLESSKEDRPLFSMKFRQLTAENESLRNEVKMLKSQMKNKTHSNSSQPIAAAAAAATKSSLKSEHKRKLTRTLLTNVKILKKALASSEYRNSQLIDDKSLSSAKIQALQRQLKHMQQKCDSSEINVQSFQQQFSSADRSTPFSNLMDDYKKLIQQSSEDSKRPTNSAIYDLIKRSNNCCPPTLKNLSNAVNDLRSDIVVYMEPHPHPVGRRIPSLMDELKAAGINCNNSEH